MRKYRFLAMLITIATTALYAQNFNKTAELSDAKKWNEAYTELQTQKLKDKKGKIEEKAEYHYWLGHVLIQAVTDSQSIVGVEQGNSHLTQLMQGFSSLKKAYELNKNLPNFILGQNTPYADFWSVYINASQKGIDAFNSKDYDKAAPSYDLAAEAGAFLSANNMGLPSIDSNLLYLRALNFVNLKNATKAAPLVEQLAQLKYNPSQGLELVKWMLFQAMDSKNQDLFQHFKQIGEINFPEHKADLWDVIEDEYKLSIPKDTYEKLKVYQTMIADGTSNRVKYNFVLETYQFILDNKTNIEDAKYTELLTAMAPVADEVFAADSKNYTMLYVYEVSLFNYVEKMNLQVSNLRKIQREKSAPVQGNPPKGSKLEKELNDLKKQISLKQTQIKTWATKAFPYTDNLIVKLESLVAEGAENNIRVQLENALDLASGLAYYAELMEKSDAFEAKRKNLSQKRK